MVEMTKKYKIGTRRFGLINWVGAWTLYKKETLRFNKLIKKNCAKLMLLTALDRFNVLNYNIMF